MAPPSFSSFPAPSKPPSFPSFPQASTSAVDERPTKRVRAADFLHGLEDELKADGKRLPSKERRDRHDDSSGKGKGRRVESDERSERKRAKEGSKRAKDKDRSYSLVKVPRERTPEPLAPVEPLVFYSDYRGDDLNIRYGGLHKGDIPRYRRLGGGRVVGLNSGLRITKETAYSGRGLEIDVSSRSKTPRYVDERSGRHMNSRHFKRIAITTRRPAALGEAPVEDDDDPFLPSSADATRFVALAVEESIPERLAKLEFEPGQDYRSITGKVTAADLESDEEDELFSVGAEGGISFDEQLRLKNLHYDRRLRENPRDIEGWIEFVEFQDEVAQASFMGGSTKRALSKLERASTSEIKLSILDRALGFTENKASEPLLLAYLRAAAEIWDPKKVLARWSETLRKNPTLTGLWIEYVSWRQTSWENFQIRDLVEVFSESFGVLSKAGEECAIGSEGRENLEGNAIYLFLRCCLMLRQAGFHERALASFQALIELNFFRPAADSRPTGKEAEGTWRDRVLASLETFWDAEGPRVGEPDAKGWKDTAEDAPAPPPLTIPVSFSATSNDHFESWAGTEHSTTISQPRPARTMDPGIDDDIDPYRCVLFDDVRDFLFIVHSPDSKIQLAYAFLTFLGIPFVPPDYPTTTPFQTDSFIHSELVERSDARDRFFPRIDETSVPFETFQGEAMEPERRGGVDNPFEIPFEAAPVSIDLLFATKQKWFVMLGKSDLTRVDIDFTRNVFAQLSPLVQDGFFSLNYFSFEACQSIKGAVKVAKSILRDNRTNLSLWDGYARLERQRNKIEEARQVYVTALSMYRTFSAGDQIDGPLLWRSWAEMEWEEGKAVLALKVLVAAAVDEELDLGALAKDAPEVRPTASQILRTRQYYTTQLEAAFQPSAPQTMTRNRNHLAVSFALFEYLSQSLAPAVEVFECHLFRLDCAGALGSAENEEMLMAYAKLLWRHSEGGKGWRPGQLRELLERAIKQFPNNAAFLKLLYSNELRTKIQNRVRRTLEETVLRENQVTSQGWLFAIFAELHLDSRVPNIWGVRNLFDRAVENPRTRTSPSLWSLFIDFEIKYGTLERAKALVYRAIRDCPWCKDLYLKPFSPSMRTLYDSTELASFYSLLLEKGLRVRVEMVPYEEPALLRGESDDEGAANSDAEEIFAERRRLMPY